MLTVVVAHPPRFGGTPASSTRRRARGARRRRRQAIPPGVAVYANGMWPAIKGREALEDHLGRSEAEKRGTAQLRRRIIARCPHARQGRRASTAMPKPRLRRGQGDRSRIRLSLSRPCTDGAARRLPAVGRRHGLARFGSQIQTLDQARSPRSSGCARRRSQIETLLAGGSFGRRATGQPISPPNWRRSPRRSARASRSSWCGRARTIFAAATTGRCSCIGCVAPCATARSSPGPTPSSASRS